MLHPPGFGGIDEDLPVVAPGKAPVPAFCHPKAFQNLPIHLVLFGQEPIGGKFGLPFPGAGIIEQGVVDPVVHRNASDVEVVVAKHTGVAPGFAPVTRTEQDVTGRFLVQLGLVFCLEEKKQSTVGKLAKLGTTDSEGDEGGMLDTMHVNCFDGFPNGNDGGLVHGTSSNLVTWGKYITNGPG